jgi:hypothetical protein
VARLKPCPPTVASAIFQTWIKSLRKELENVFVAMEEVPHTSRLCSWRNFLTASAVPRAKTLTSEDT